MSDVLSVCIPQETVNDDLVLIQQWRVADGQAVKSGQLLVEVETSKSVFEINSPADGFIRLNAASAQEVPIGRVLCYVGETLEAVDASRHITPTTPTAIVSGNSGQGRLAVETKPVAQPSATTEQTTAGPQTDVRTTLATSSLTEESCLSVQSMRFSRKALALIQMHHLSVDHFAGRGLVRSQDILREIEIFEPWPAVTSADGNEQPASSLGSRPSNASPKFRSAAGVPFRREALSRSRRLETKVLSWSTQQAIRSSVTVMVPTEGRHLLQEKDFDAVEKLTASIIHSSAQLLRQFPLLNACCIDDQIMVYEQVHIGYALDAGHGLKVAVLRDTDEQSISAIIEERQRLIAAYLKQSLLPADLSGATFTITDLSGSGVTTFDPIIPEGQAGILGIGGEFPIGNGQQAFHLVLSFDHRLVEGRAAAMFLNQLKDLVRAFEQTLLAPPSSVQTALESRCARCGITLSSAAQRNHFLVSVAGAQNSSSFICTICLQGR